MIPNYTLYGENKGEIFPDTLHCESIAARSVQHDWTIAPHRHHALHQFFFLASGGGSLSMEGETRRVAAPVVISIPPLAVHGFEFVRNTEGWVITIPDLVLSEILPRAPDVREALSVPIIMKGTTSIAACFEQISDEHRSHNLGRGQLLTHMAGMLAIEICRAYSGFSSSRETVGNRRESLFREFLMLLELNFRTHHSVAEYAELLNLTAPHLTRTCRQVISRSASELIQDRLILEAKRSLVYTRMSISEIAYSLGFSDPAYFSKFFQRRTGLSPSSFREKSDPVSGTLEKAEG